MVIVRLNADSPELAKEAAHRMGLRLIVVSEGLTDDKPGDPPPVPPDSN
jgi:hypothetical protein